MKSVKIAAKGADYAPLDDFIHFQGNLKVLTEENYIKLKKKIIKLGFSEPLSVWLKDDQKILLNGHQRITTLKRMRDEENYQVPYLPYSVVEAKNEAEAKQKVLSLASEFGKVTEEGLAQFAVDNELKIADIQDSFSFHAIDYQKVSELITAPVTKEVEVRSHTRSLTTDKIEIDDEEDSTEKVEVTKFIFDQNTIARTAFDYFRSIGFPYTKLTLHEQMQEMNKLASLSEDKLLRSRLGYAVADHYHSHRFEASAIKMSSPLQSFKDDKKLMKAIKWQLEDGGNIGAGMFGKMTLVSGTQACSNFRPAFARYLYEKYCKEGGTVFDSSTGYGGRLIGFLASHCGEYIGTDPNVPTYKANLQISKVLGQHKKIRLYNQPIEDLNVDAFKNKCDFAFTSPPYYIKETYSDAKTQSCVRYKKIDEWLNKFLKPMLKKQHEVLKKGVFNIVNIEDVNIGGKEFKLVEPTIQFAKDIGFEFIELKKFEMATRTFIQDGEKVSEMSSESVIVLKKT